MKRTDNFHVALLGMHGYSARGICKLILRNTGHRLSTQQVYRILKVEGVKLWRCRHAQTRESLSRGNQLVLPKLKRKAG